MTPATAADLPAAARDALLLIADQPLYRTRGGWRAAGTRTVTIHTAATLASRGLAVVSHVKFRRRIAPTAAGRALATLLRAKP